MRTTKLLTAIFLAVATLPAAAQPAPIQPKRTAICLNVRDIVDASSRDGLIMTFKMRDGTTYNNHLRQRCDSLRDGGFVWTTEGSQQICEDVQQLRTLTIGEMCRLGRFDPPVKKTASAQ
jgi:hypothetical protein